MSLFVMSLPIIGLVIAALSLWMGVVFGRGSARPDLAERIRTLNSAVDQGNIRFARTAAELRDSRLKVSELQATIERLGRESAEKDSALIDLNKQVADLQTEVTTHVADLKKEVATLTDKISARDAAIERAGGTIMQQGRRVGELEKQVESLTVERDRMATRMWAVRMDVTRLVEQLGGEDQSQAGDSQSGDSQANAPAA